MHLPLPALRAFEAAARHGSFRRAAEEIHVSPSAISHAVRRLEETVRTPLFIRSGPRVDLTPAGDTLRRHVERGFAELARGMGAVACNGPQLLRLHSALSFATQWLTPRGAVVFTHAKEILTRQMNSALRRCVEACNDGQQGAFTGARSADNRSSLLGSECEINIAQNGQCTGRVADRLENMLNGNN